MIHPKVFGNEKIKITSEGGLAIKLTNKTGAASVKGTLVDPHTTIDFAVVLVPAGLPDIIGVMYESGVPDGAECWVVVSGLADVMFIGDVTPGQFARMSIAADTGDAPGHAIAENLPTAPFATDKHFMEIGHCLQARTGAGLARVVLHFN